MILAILLTIFGSEALGPRVPPTLASQRRQAVDESAPLQPTPRAGAWHAWLDSPGGSLPFGLEFVAPATDSEQAAQGADGWSAFIINGDERILIPELEFRGRSVRMSMPHYDSVLEAELRSDGRSLDGTWRKRRGLERWTVMGFHASAGASPRFEPAPSSDSSLRYSIDGRWSVKFESDDNPAVGIFETRSGMQLGTFLTSTGDYRYLSGSLEGKLLRLSCFDGAHAFLFRARLREDGSLSGQFWSRESWNESWTAVRDPKASIPDPYGQTTINARTALTDFVFPDLAGQPRSPMDPAFSGRARIIQVFGSWCPNCHDETKFLVELDKQYRKRGLSILGLAFELTGDFERDSEQVRTFVKRHNVRYPILIAGLADKDKASRAFPFLDAVRSYPTAIFLHADGRVRAVHQGFTGPATGEAYTQVREEFENLVEELLAEEGNPAAELWARLEGSRLVLDMTLPGGDPQLSMYQFENTNSGPRALLTEMEVDAWGETRPITLRMGGSVTVLNGELWSWDPKAMVWLDPSDCGRRLVEPLSPFTRTPLLVEAGFDRSAELGTLDLEGLRRALKQDDPLLRREAVLRLATAGSDDELGALRGLFSDPDPAVRAMAAWAAGLRGLKSARGLLIQNLSDPNANLRRESARALCKLGSDDPETRAALAKLAGDQDPLVRAAAKSLETSSEEQPAVPQTR